MNILIVSYYDDNYGDMLIRICFSGLLETVLGNLGFSQEQYRIHPMSLKGIDEDAVRSCDLIFFAGGGLFGLSYLDFFRYVDRITEIAEECSIPVVFSSTGVNNMDAREEKEGQLVALLQRSCIRAISVRENPALFQSFCDREDLVPRQVCDPAVWTRFLYHIEPEKSLPEHRPLIGINVVRGGLFRDNGYAWGLWDEMRYLEELRRILDEAGMDYRLYTNGSLLDNNTLRYYAKLKKVPEEKLVYHQTTRELVHTISGFDAVFSIRLHSSIISYSFGIPCLNLVWNDKIPHFYHAIGYPENAVRLEEWDAPSLFQKMQVLLRAPYSAPDQAYMMSLYTFLYDTLKKLTGTTHAPACCTFPQVLHALKGQEITEQEDLTDLYRKVTGAERKYLALFSANKKTEKELKKVKALLAQKEQEALQNQPEETFRKDEETEA